MRAAVTPVVAVLAALAVAGCGEKHETTTGGASGSGSAPAGVTVSETEFKLSPASPQVPNAGPVTFQVKNDGTTTHALVVQGPNGAVKTGAIAPGKTATLKADLGKAGTYQMYCPIDGHKDKGMKGEIKVGSGGASSGGSSGGSGSSSGGGGGGY